LHSAKQRFTSSARILELPLRGGASRRYNATKNQVVAGDSAKTG
jgi:hypothetical protein